MTCFLKPDRDRSRRIDKWLIQRKCEIQNIIRRGAWRQKNVIDRRSKTPLKRFVTMRLGSALLQKLSKIHATSNPKVFKIRCHFCALPRHLHKPRIMRSVFVSSTWWRSIFHPQPPAPHNAVSKDPLGLCCCSIQSKPQTLFLA